MTELDDDTSDNVFCRGRKVTSRMSTHVPTISSDVLNHRHYCLRDARLWYRAAVSVFTPPSIIA